MTLHRPISLDQLAGLPGEYLAGGTDLSERLNSGISQGPIVDLMGLPGLKEIEDHPGAGISIGSGVRLTALASETRIRTDYPALAQTAGSLATPQIRNVATLGGVLCQRSRCTWYRHPDFSCFKNGGTGCPARAAENDHGVLFDLGPCVHPHPSSVALALLVYNASFDTNRRTAIPIAQLFGDGSDPLRDHQLGEGEVLLRVILPERSGDLAIPGAGYSRLMGRQAAEWPWAECVVQISVIDRRIDAAAVAVGAVASIPLNAPQVAAALVGLEVGDEAGAARAAAKVETLAPLYPPNRHKLAMLKGTIIDALDRAWRVEPVPGSPINQNAPAE